MFITVILRRVCARLVAFLAETGADTNSIYSWWPLASAAGSACDLVTALKPVARASVLQWWPLASAADSAGDLVTALKPVARASVLQKTGRVAFLAESTGDLTVSLIHAREFGDRGWMAARFCASP
jgi:hypothetical protein